MKQNLQILRKLEERLFFFFLCAVPTSEPSCALKNLASEVEGEGEKVTKAKRQESEVVGR